MFRRISERYNFLTWMKRTILRSNVQSPDDVECVFLHLGATLLFYLYLSKTINWQIIKAGQTTMLGSVPVHWWP